MSLSFFSLSQRERIAGFLAIIGLYGFSLSVDLSTAGSNIFPALILVASVLLADVVWKDLRRLPVFWLIIALATYVLIQSLIAVYNHPELDQATKPHWTHFLRITGIFSIFAAWWIVRYRSHMPWLLLAVAVSIVLGRFLDIDLSELLEEGLGRRRTFGSSPIRVGYLAATGTTVCAATLVYLLAFSQRIRKRWLYISGITTTCVFLLYFIFILIGAQTRGAWLGAISACSVLLLIYLRQAFRMKNTQRRVSAAGMILAVGLGLTLIMTNGGDIIERRVTNQMEAVQLLLNGDRDGLLAESPSIGLRINMWYAAIEAFKERPVFGYGTGSKMILLAEGSRFDREFETGGPSGHFHNLYLETLVSLGLMGSIGFILVFVTLFRSFLLAWQQRQIPQLTFLVVGTFWTMTPFAVITNILIGYPSSRGLIMFMMAFLCTAPILLRQVQMNSHETEVPVSLSYAPARISSPPSD